PLDQGIGGLGWLGLARALPTPGEDRAYHGCRHNVPSAYHGCLLSCVLQAQKGGTNRRSDTMRLALTQNKNPVQLTCACGFTAPRRQSSRACRRTAALWREPRAGWTTAH